MTTSTLGTLQKMQISNGTPAEYLLPVGAGMLPMNPLLGTVIRFRFSGRIVCSHCGKQTRRSYSQGFCYRCFQRLPQCDLCMMSPDRCHFLAGTCRDNDFAERVCMQRHYVYLANSSGIKVGITRVMNVPGRWLDQGAVQAMIIAHTQSRYQAGLFEAACREHLSDRTQWQRMLMANDAHIDLGAFYAEQRPILAPLAKRWAVTLIEQPAVTSFQYPVLQYPTRVTALKPGTDAFEATLLGLKGQYLILSTGVINIRKYTGYEVEITPLDQKGETASQLSLL